jgi:hypothetical protein
MTQNEGFILKNCHNCLEYEEVLWIFYCHICNIAKFGYTYLWMLATSATPQNWEKKKKKKKSH